MMLPLGQHHRRYDSGGEQTSFQEGRHGFSDGPKLLAEQLSDLAQSDPGCWEGAYELIELPAHACGMAVSSGLAAAAQAAVTAAGAAIDPRGANFSGLFAELWLLSAFFLWNGEHRGQS